MGGSNPIRSVVDTVVDGTVDLYTGAIREGARAAGLDGVVDGMEKFKGVVGGVTDMATGAAKEKKQKATDEANRNNQIAAAAGKRASDAAAAKENTRIEGERMSAGSGSRTLLTGPAGLEDEEGSVSRKYLTGV